MNGLANVWKVKVTEQALPLKSKWKWFFCMFNHSNSVKIFNCFFFPQGNFSHHSCLLLSSHCLVRFATAFSACTACASWLCNTYWPTGQPPILWNSLECSHFDLWKLQLKLKKVEEKKKKGKLKEKGEKGVIIQPCISHFILVCQGRLQL